MLLPLPLGVFYLYHLDFDADAAAAADARCGYSLRLVLNPGQHGLALPRREDGIEKI